MLAKINKPRIVRSKSVPGYDNKRELRPAQVESPYRKGEMEVRVRNTRESQLSAMHQRGTIDDAQLMAGQWVRQNFEAQTIGLRISDPGRVVVDTSGEADGTVPDRALDAGTALSLARAELGALGWPVVEMVCGEGLSLTDAAYRLHGEATDRTRGFTGHLLRAALDVLAVYLGYATKMPSRKKTR